MKTLPPLGNQKKAPEPPRRGGKPPRPSPPAPLSPLSPPPHLLGMPQPGRGGELGARAGVCLRSGSCMPTGDLPATEYSRGASPVRSREFSTVQLSLWLSGTFFRPHRRKFQKPLRVSSLFYGNSEFGQQGIAPTCAGPSSKDSGASYIRMRMYIFGSTNSRLGFDSRPALRRQTNGVAVATRDLNPCMVQFFVRGLYERIM